MNTKGVTGKVSSSRRDVKGTPIAHSKKGIKAMLVVESFLGRLGEITL